MDLRAYDAVTTALVNKILDQQQNMDRGVFRTCSRLKKAAEEASDHSLLGFACYQMADAYYSQEISHEKFRACLKQAVVCLQAADDAELLVRVFNYVGIDAMYHGCYDVAYYYYKMALKTCERVENNSYLMCIVTANIGQIYRHLGDVKRARKYLRASNYRRMKNDNGEIYFLHNMIVGCYLEAVSCMEMDDIEGAKKLCAKIDSLMSHPDGGGSDGVVYLAAIVRAETALLCGEKQQFEQFLAEAVTTLSGMSQLNDYVEETVQFCRFLLASNITEPVKALLDAINRRETGTTQAARMVTATEAAYYEQTGNMEQAEACLRRRYALSAEHEREQNGIYLYSIELIETMGRMRKESARVQEENRILLQQSHTDALTGIANRLMMNKLLEQTFEHAYATGTRFGLEILDVNYFKEYNDNYGHRAGDACLVRIAEVLARRAETEGVYCTRYGGDEFVVIYENKTDEEIMESALALEADISALNISNKAAGYRKHVTVSQGICNDIPGRKNKSYDFLAEADSALYEVKSRIAGNRKPAHAICLRHLPDVFG